VDGGERAQRSHATGSIGGELALDTNPLTKLPDSLQRICADLVIADAAETDLLGEVHARLAELRGELVELHPAAAPAVDSALAFLAGIVAGDAADPAADLAGATDAVEAVRVAAEQGAAPAPQDAGHDEVTIEFLSGQRGNLDEVEDLVLGLESGASEATLSELRGRLHTLKGEAGVLGFADVSSACHAIEEHLAGGAEAAAPDVLLRFVDWLRARFQAESAGAAPPPPFSLGSPPAEPATEPAPAAAPAPAPAPAPAADRAVPDCVLQPQPVTGDPELVADFVAEACEHLEEVDAQLLALERNADDAEACNSIFRAFHTIKGVASFIELDVIKLLAHAAENVLDLVRKGLLRISGEVLAAAFDANDALKHLIQDVQSTVASGTPAPPRANLPAVLAKLQAIEAAVAGGATGAQHAAARPTAPPAPIPPASSAPRAASADAGGQGGPLAGSDKAALRDSVKVDAGRLDQLVDMIGELVIAETMVSQSDELDMDGMQRLPGLIGHMDKITRELQELAMSLRMVPIRSTFRRMARLARDVAAKTGKQVELVTRGEDTELDKTVVDAIGDPLIHMIRNAVDHGVEADPAERVAAGKPARGRIELRAFHRGGSIHVEIEDDGRGLDTERILAKARERGTVGPDEVLSEHEIHNLIFAPGVSTAATVTEVSGRGVGMDVVRRNIEAMRGRTEIRSQKGRGSVFSIRLPLTLAIIDGMIVRVADRRYALPTISIVRMLRPDEIVLTKVFGRGSLLQVGDEILPLFRLDELFGIEREGLDHDRESAVIVEHEGRKWAFVVDAILGQQQIVIKPLGPAFQDVVGLAGGAIMPDGQVGLIIDVAGIVRRAGQGEGASGDKNEAPRSGAAAEELE
jgi:two-component system chemotaxis sensor kinase CheA